MSELPKRKIIRLQNYDYGQNGAYFITICTKDRQNFLGSIVGTDDPVRPFEIDKSKIGVIVEDCWNTINTAHENVKTDAFCIMPNHIHGIILINNAVGQSRPTLQKIIQGFKSITTRLCFPLGYKTIWQHSYYDHVIRNEEDYLQIWQYIEENPAKWAEDKYYCVN